MQQRFEPQLEQYLDSLERPLAKLPAQERREWREEAAQHLSGLIAANEELGAEREEAVAAALAQFGDAKAIARRMRQEASRRVVPLTLLQATAGGLCVLMATAAVVATAMGCLASAYIKGFDVSDDPLRAAAIALFVSAPVIGGVVLGDQIPRWRIKGGKKADNRHWPYFLLAIVSELFIVGMLYAVMGTFAFSFPYGGAHPNTAFSLVCVALTIAGVDIGYVRARLRRKRLAGGTA